MLTQSIAPSNQTINLAPIADQTYGNVPTLLQATSSSGLLVSYSVVSGPATISGPFLYITGAGTVDVEATQSGDSSFNAATAVDQTFNVAPAPLTFTVADEGTENGSAPAFTGWFSGFVNDDGPDSVTTQPTFTLASPVNGPGTYVINAGGAVAANYQISDVSGTLTVSPGLSQTSLAPTLPTNVVYGQDVPVAVAVTGGPGAGTPTGTVTFVDNDVPIGTATLSNGTATLNFSDWSLGSHDVTATYNGDPNFDPSVATDQIVTATPDASIVGLSVQSAGGASGAIVSATVSAGVPGAGTPTGTVQFMDGATVIGTATLANGVASIAVGSAVAPQISAVYSGDVNFLPSSAQGSQSPANEVSVSLTSSTIGDGVVGVATTFTAKVTALIPGTDIHDGSVQFLDGTSLLATSSIQNGVATFSSTLAVGSHPITAEFLGIDGSAASSPILPLTVDRAVPMITVSATGGTYDGQAFAATATIAGVNRATRATSLEGVGLTLDYQLLDSSGNVVQDLGSVAPVHGGTYLAIASFAGSADYAPGFASTIFVIGQATATITVSGYSGAYDGNGHGATGSATGVNGEDLSSLLDLGSTFVDAPGGTAQWSFAGNADYAPASGQASIAHQPGDGQHHRQRL